MSFAAHLLANALRIVAGYVAASLVGGFVLVVVTLVATAAKSDPELPTLAAGALFSAMFFALFVGFFALVPGMVAIAEAIPVRAWWFFTLAGVAAAGSFIVVALDGEGPPAERGAVATILFAGATAGCVYWAVAGRLSGAWREVTSPA